MIDLQVTLRDDASPVFRALASEIESAAATLGQSAREAMGGMQKSIEDTHTAMSGLREGSVDAETGFVRQSRAARESLALGRESLQLADQVSTRFGQAMGQVLLTGRSIGESLRKATAQSLQGVTKNLTKLASERLKAHLLERRLLKKSSASETAREGKGIFLKVFRFFSGFNPFIAGAAAVAFTALAMKGAEKVSAKLGGLREGGLVERETVARFAEGGRPELALPLDNPRAQAKIREALGGGGPVIAPTIHIQGFGDEESVVRDIARVMERLRDDKDVRF